MSAITQIKLDLRERMQTLPLGWMALVIILLTSQNSVAEDAAYYIEKSFQMYNNLENISVKMRFDMFAGPVGGKSISSVKGSVMKHGSNYRSNFPENEIVQNSEMKIVCDKKTRKIIIEKDPAPMPPFAPVDLTDALKSAERTDVLLRTTKKQVEVQLSFSPSGWHGLRRMDALLSTTDFSWIKGTLLFTEGPRLEVTYSAIETNPKFHGGQFSDAQFYRMVLGKPKGVGTYRNYQVEVLDQNARAVHKIRIAGKPLEEWLEMLEVEDSAEDEQAVKVLRENAAKVVPLLIRILEGKNSTSEQKQDDDGSVELDRNGFLKTPDMLRERAMKALPRIGSAAKAAIPVLIGALDDISMDAEHAISSFGTDAALPLIEALTNRHERIRQTASSLLGSLDLKSLPEAVPELTKLLDHADAEIRSAALTGLSRIGRQLPIVIPVVARRLTDRDSGVRSRAASVLGDAGVSASVAVFDVTKLLSDENPYCRASAADALGKIGEKAAESLPHLIKTLEDQAGFVRVSAASAIWKISKQRDAAMPVLKAALKEKEHSVRWHAAVEMGDIEPGNQDAIEALIRMLSDDPQYIN